ncbi:glycosyl transferase [Xylanimonas oleitrophica]|uniref:Glycosyl transferase n=1 Tax=Xylanimonas oleitrophica TaxID=2607479 RepID=A0A2W5YGK0_9MICO|nr:glycosyltransferase family 2 protein [Xylanimonas oleitrophica]PZR53861.1 glycosyl transferase [Xylanimonas oleitrophica]
MNPAKLLTVVVPSYNSAAYLHRCLDSLVGDGTDVADVEVLIVDDGSWDETPAIGARYAERYPGVVRVVSKPNGGHGSAVNTGVDHAQGLYLKVVDSDDWLDAAAFARLREALRGFAGDPQAPDMVVTNYVYENVDRRRRAAVRYTEALVPGRTVTWDQVGRFRKSQYMLMHSLVYRTGLLRESGLRLPEHTFYVDNLYAFVPLVHVRRLHYLDVDLYRYFIGRSDQSVNETVMISRVDQQLRVNRMMMEHLSAVRSDPRVPRALRRYLLHYVGIVCVVSSMLLIRAGTRDAIAQKDRFWRELRQADEALYWRLRLSVMGQLVNLPGRPGREVSVLAYKAAQRALGFN